MDLAGSLVVSGGFRCPQTCSRRIEAAIDPSEQYVIRYIVKRNSAPKAPQLPVAQVAFTVTAVEE
jgi:hypothetical protein